MNYNRRKFISLGVSGGVGFLLSNSIGASILKNITTKVPIKNNVFSNDLQAALALAKEGHALRLKKSFDLAEKKYKEAIQLVPKDVRFYDGLRKVFAQQRGKEQDIIDLYYSAYKKYPNLASFNSRLADIFCQTALGNKKLSGIIAQKYNLTSLENEAQRLYTKAIELNANHKNYPQKLKKIKQFKTNNAFKDDFRQNSLMKDYHKKNIKAEKLQLNKLTEEQLDQRLTRLQHHSIKPLNSVNEEKNRTEVIEKKQKRIYYRLFNIQKADKNWIQATIVAEKLHQLYPNDSKGLVLLKRSYIRTKSWDKLVDMSRNRYNAKPTLWRGLSLMSAIEKAYLKSGSGNIQEALNIGTVLIEKNKENVANQIKISMMMAHHYIASKSYSNALSIFDSLQTKIIQEKLFDPTTINEFFSNKALCLMKKGDYIGAERILKIGLKKDDLVNNTADIHVQLSKQKIKETLAQKRMMEITLAKVYLKHDQGKAGEQISHILSLYPNDKFALKRR
ncbi:hypothetical protein [Cloacibacterium sp.]|uniref:tetratricopeptide repeat protein n=1 Tax=Cloacibacterium sp. TaxID=1913682 RepID=UPI0035B2A1A6